MFTPLERRRARVLAVEVAEDREAELKAVNDPTPLGGAVVPAVGEEEGHGEEEEGQGGRPKKVGDGDEEAGEEGKLGA